MRSIARFVVAASLAALTVTPAAAANFLVTYEAAGVKNSTAGFDYFGIETFDDKQGQSSFTSTFNYDGVTIDLTYTDVVVIPADKYGGANETPYAVVGLESSTRSYSIDVSTSSGDGINYFGYWLSALDGANFVSFYKTGVADPIFSFSPEDVEALLLNKPGYHGHPGPGQYTGENGGEPYVFLNFFSQDSTFDRIVFTQAPGNAGYESDNHTVGFYNTTSGTPITEVPEPAAIGLLGAGLLGLAALCRRRRA